MGQWSDDWPDWTDGSRVVELLMPDGSIVTGTLEVRDVEFDGTDEGPIWDVRCPDGSAVNFVDHDRWRFATSAARIAHPDDAPRPAPRDDRRP